MQALIKQDPAKMKVSKLYLYVMSALLLVSCGSKTSDSSEADDSAAREKAIADSIAEADSKWKADSLDYPIVRPGAAKASSPTSTTAAALTLCLRRINGMA